MDFYEMPINDAIKLLKHSGFNYLATSLEQAIAQGAVAEPIAKLPQDEQQPGVQEQPIVDPFEALLETRGYKLPSNTR